MGSGMSASRSVQPVRRFLADQRGAIALEYVAVAVVGLMAAVGLGALGVELAQQHRSALQVLRSEYP